MKDSDMQISADEGQFLQMLVKLIGAKKTLEVGVFTGYSSLAVALALPEDGKVFALDVSEEYTNVARRYWKEAGVEHKIDLRLAPGVETLTKLIAEGHSGTFDFAFIDADKQNYYAYYEKTLELLRPNGLIAVDNVFWSGKVANESNQEERTICIREFNTKLKSDNRIDISMLAIGDGVTLARKK